MFVMPATAWMAIKLVGILWAMCLVATGIGQLIECGPGKVLTGLNRRIERRPGLEYLALEDPASIDAALAATRQ